MSSHSLIHDREQAVDSVLSCREVYCPFDKIFHEDEF